MSEPREFDTEYTATLPGAARRRVGIDSNRGTVTRFTVQIEYWLNGEWREVVRSDHDPASKFGHDVREEGVHLDIYREGEKVREEEILPPMLPDDALGAVTTHLAEHAEGYIKRFEEWHDA